MRSSNPPAPRYTLAFEPTAEAHVAQDLARLSTGLASELGDALRSLLLVGPFARAEGTMARHGGERAAALPGYELLLVLRRSPDRFQRVLPAISATWSRLLATRVALFAVVESTLARPPRTRAYFHAGERQALELLAETGRPITCARFASTELDAAEVDQALLEGLCALALARLEAPDDGARLLDRARRAVLASGDAILLAHGLYAATLHARDAALHHAGASSALCEVYGALAARDAPMLEGSAAHTALGTLLRTLTSAVLELQAARTGSAREHAAYLRSAPPDAESGSERSGWRTATLGLFGPAEPPVPRAPLLRACIAVALGDAAPDSLAFAARVLASAHDPSDGPANAPAALARALRRAARAVLAPRIGQPFGDWALVPEPV